MIHAKDEREREKGETDSKKSWIKIPERGEQVQIHAKENLFNLKAAAAQK